MVWFIIWLLQIWLRVKHRPGVGTGRGDVYCFIRIFSGVFIPSLSNRHRRRWKNSVADLVFAKKSFFGDKNGSWGFFKVLRDKNHPVCVTNGTKLPDWANRRSSLVKHFKTGRKRAKNYKKGSFVPKRAEELSEPFRAKNWNLYKKYSVVFSLKVFSSKGLHFGTFICTVRDWVSFRTFHCWRCLTTTVRQFQNRLENSTVTILSKPC